MDKDKNIGICKNCGNEFMKKNPETLQYKKKFCCNLCTVEYYRKIPRKKKQEPQD